MFAAILPRPKRRLAALTTEMRIIALLLTASASHATAVYSADWDGFAAGVMLTSTAVGASPSGYWTEADQGLNGPSVCSVQPSPRLGKHAATLNAANGWCFIGNSRTAYAYTDLKARVSTDEQAWICTRWDGGYSGFQLHGGYYLQVHGAGSWNFGYVQGGHQTVKASGSGGSWAKAGFNAEVVDGGNTHTAFINGVKLGGFWDDQYASGGIAFGSSHPTTASFADICMDDGVATPTFTYSPVYSATQSPTQTATPTPTCTVGPSARASGPLGLAAMTMLSRLPEQKMWTQAIGQSSYDRSGANRDHNKYLYGTRGDMPAVLADFTGPGCVYRLWGTGNDLPGMGLSIEVDGHPTQVSRTAVATVFSGAYGALAAPLVVSSTVSSGGYCSYLPIPFQHSCRILNNNDGHCYDYYNIGAHLYAANTILPSWTGSEDASAAKALWRQIPGDPKDDAGELTATGRADLAGSGGASTIFDLKGAYQIVGLTLSVPGNTVAELNAIRIKVYWDGNAAPAVNAPLSFFFNAGGLYPITVTPQQLMAGIDGHGCLYNYFPMPFAAGATIKLVNTGASPVDGIIYWVNYLPHPGPFAGVGYLHSQYKASVLRSGTGTSAIVNLLTATGFGSYLGSVISIDGTSEFQEGDEAVYVDGSNTPAIHGTGTEDYGNAGWGWLHGPFSQPMDGCSYMRAYPIGAPGPVNFTRLFLQDQVPYLSGIQVNMQAGATCTVAVNASFTSLAWYYNQPMPLISKVDALDLGSPASAAAHAYHTTGRLVTLSGSYLEDVSSVCEAALSASGYSYGPDGTGSFDASIPADNAGLILRGTFDQTDPARAAQVSVNGHAVGVWHMPGANAFHPWVDSDFMVPPNFTSGSSQAHIQMTNVSGTAWSEYKYQVFSVAAFPAVAAHPPSPSPTPEP